MKRANSPMVSRVRRAGVAERTHQKFSAFTLPLRHIRTDSHERKNGGKGMSTCSLPVYLGTDSYLA